MEVALAAGAKSSALAHVAGSTGAAYAGPWQHFVEWCSSLARPRCPLPADDFTVALYLQSVVERSKSFALVKSASAAIDFFQKVNLFNHLPTHSLVVGMVRQAAARKFGLTPKGRKEPSQWAQVVAFAQAYVVQHQGLLPFSCGFDGRHHVRGYVSLQRR